MDKNTAPDRHIDAHSKPSTLASNLPGALPGAAKSPFTRRVLHAPPGYRAGLSAETNSHHLGPSPRERRFSGALLSLHTPEPTRTVSTKCRLRLTRSGKVV